MDFRHAGTLLTDHTDLFQLLLFATILIGMWLIEKFAGRELAGVKWRHTATNALFMLSALPIQLGMMLLCSVAAAFVTRHHVGLLYLLPDADDPWIKYGLMFFVLDFLDYVYHLAAHKIPAIWRFHLVHHVDQALDVSTTFREHPGETLIRTGFLILWVLLCGASVEILILRQSVESAANILSHTRFRLPPRSARVLGWFFITPNLHHAHHHNALPATNCNYGDVFSLWDRICGTLIDLARADTVFGLDTHMDVPARGHYQHLLIAPFRAMRRSGA